MIYREDELHYMFYPFSKPLLLSVSLESYFSRMEADSLLAKNTIEKYKEVARMLLSLLGDIDIRYIDDITVTGLKQKLNKVGLSPSRKNHYLIVLRGLLEFLREQGNKVGTPKITKYPVPTKQVEFLTKEELMNLISSLEERTITQIRLKAVFLALLSTGARITELLSLDRDNVDFSTGIASMITKGNKPHRVIFNDSALKYIQMYLAKRNDSYPALFATIKGEERNRLSANDVERKLRQLGKKLGMRLNLRPHLLRKSAATLMYREGVSIGIVQSFLNHSSPAVTAKFYLGNLGFEDVKTNHQRVMNFDWTQ